MPAHPTLKVQRGVRARLVAACVVDAWQTSALPVESWKVRRMRDERSEVHKVVLHAPRRPRSWNASVKPSYPKAPSSYLIICSHSFVAVPQW